MRVKDLIKELEQFPSDAWVTIPCSEDIWVNVIWEDKAVTIEPKDECMQCSKDDRIKISKFECLGEDNEE